MFNKLKDFWRTIRRLSGDDAYEQYLKHFVENHAEQAVVEEATTQPLSREAFFKEWQDNKWKGFKRCC